MIMYEPRPVVSDCSRFLKNLKTDVIVPYNEILAKEPGFIEVYPEETQTVKPVVKKRK